MHLPGDACAFLYPGLCVRPGQASPTSANGYFLPPSDDGPAQAGRRSLEYILRRPTERQDERVINHEVPGTHPTGLFVHEPWPILAIEMTQQAIAHRTPSNQQERRHGHRPNRHTEPDSMTPGNIPDPHGSSLPIRGTPGAALSRNLCLILLEVNEARRGIPGGACRVPESGASGPPGAGSYAASAGPGRTLAAAHNPWVDHLRTGAHPPAHVLDKPALTWCSSEIRLGWGGLLDTIEGGLRE